MTEVVDHTAPLFGPLPKITVESQLHPEGVTYQTRPLGLKDLFSLDRIVREIVGRGSIEIDLRLQGLNIKDSMLRNIGTQLIMGLASSEDEIITWLASVIEQPAEVLRDPRQFPLGSEMDLINAIADHPDLNRFFLRLRQSEVATRMLQRITVGGSNKSTESSNDMASQTTTSVG